MSRFWSLTCDFASRTVRRMGRGYDEFWAAVGAQAYKEWLRVSRADGQAVVDLDASGLDPEDSAGETR